MFGVSQRLLSQSPIGISRQQLSGLHLEVNLLVHLQRSWEFKRDLLGSNLSPSVVCCDVAKLFNILWGLRFLICEGLLVRIKGEEAGRLLRVVSGLW